MKAKYWLAMAAAAALLGGGCSTHYVMTLNNGMRVTTATKPKLQGGVYVFKDANGQDAYVPAGRVREIAPASMVSEDKPRFSAPPAR